MGALRVVNRHRLSHGGTPVAIPPPPPPPHTSSMAHKGHGQKKRLQTPSILFFSLPLSHNTQTHTYTSLRAYSAQVSWGPQSVGGAMPRFLVGTDRDDLGGRHRRHHHAERRAGLAHDPLPRIGRRPHPRGNMRAALSHDRRRGECFSQNLGKAAAERDRA